MSSITSAFNGIEMDMPELMTQVDEKGVPVTENQQDNLIKNLLNTANGKLFGKASRESTSKTFAMPQNSTVEFAVDKRKREYRKAVAA